MGLFRSSIDKSNRLHVFLNAGLYLVLMVFLFFRVSDHPVVFGRYSVRFSILLLAYFLFFFPYFKIVYFLFKNRQFVRNEYVQTFAAFFFKVFTYWFSIVLCLMPLEIYLRTDLSNFMDLSNFFEERNIARFHPFLQAVPLKGDKQLNTNTAGFRGREITKEKPKGVYRIFVMGGSAVFSGDQPYELTHCAILEKKLRERYPDKNIEVLNAGAHWYTTEHALIQYLFTIKDYQPDMIIMWNGINDFYRSFSPKQFAFGKFQSDYSHFYGPISRMVFQYFKSRPLIEIHLFSVTYLLRTFYTKVSANKLAIKRMKPVEISEFPSLKPFDRNTVSFVQNTTLNGVKLILATQPVLYREGLNQKELDSLWIFQTMCNENGKYPSLKSVTLGMNAFNQKTRSIAQTLNIPLIDLDAKMPKTAQYLLDDCHYTKEGNALIADELLNFLVDHHYFE
ncbi:MAG: hypothetical protein A3C35_07235 [Omnitrophica bacterium RIFCSPHIGHO2_02_FULL_46_11]|nr:MAG: hypothetical protein A3C35_07235 [Omnitrophica bacterium RIFCSPHIGHO2_02_FULL_46_11]OGW87383.1 MAG: hypothetical protein A3A81_04655 [Omnitrophica bacterium RIFCSPLOWO2_01_FULL_45_10b]